MDFITIRQYFHKVHIGVLSFVLLPLMVFIGLSLTSVRVDNDTYIASLVPGIFIAVVVVNLCAIFFFLVRLSHARKGAGLRAKLERYYRIVLVFYALMALSGLLLAAGYCLTQRNAYALTFIANLALCAMAWPYAKRTAHQLRLRGDEFEMVYYQKDQF